MKTPSSGAGKSVHSVWYILYISGYYLRAHVPPPKRKPKPAAKPKPKLPMCRAIYDYDAQDTDELNVREGDVIELINKGTLLLLIGSW